MSTVPSTRGVLGAPSRWARRVGIVGERKPLRKYCGRRANGWVPSLRDRHQSKKEGKRVALYQVIGLAQSPNLVQKCDGKPPCKRCTPADSTSERACNDEEDPESEGIVPLFGTDDPISGQHLGSVDPVEIPTTIPAHPPTPLDPTPSTDTTWVVADELPDLRVLAAGRFPRGPSSGLVLVHRNSFGRRISLDSNSSIPIASSSMPPTILPEQRIPLPSLGERKLSVQFSEIEATDLDLRLCVLDWECSVTSSPSDVNSRLWVLPRLPKLGVQLSPRRLDAFIRGDQSGAVLDPVFVCGAHILGMGFSPDVSESPAMVRLSARRAQIAWESLVEILKSDNYGVTVQALVQVVASYILLRMMQTGAFYIQKSCDAIDAGGLQFIPIRGRPPEFSEDLHEILVALSQTIYWTNYLFLVCGNPTPRATARLEKEFRLELPVGDVTFTLQHLVDFLLQQAYPILFEICPLTMRTQGILLVRDVILLLKVLPVDGERYTPTSVSSG